MTSYADAMYVVNELLVEKIKKQCKYAHKDGTCDRMWFVGENLPIDGRGLPCNPLCCPMDIEVEK